MWQEYFQPQALDDALALLARYGEDARIVAGGTDVIVELSRGIRPTSTLIDVTAIPGLRRIGLTDGIISLGALTTHNDVVASPLCRQRALPLAQACWEVGAPQIRTRGTIAGNLITASPANDTITPLVALDAEIVLASARGERSLRLEDFYLGVRRTALAPDELLREIRFPAMRENQRGRFVKLGLRRAQAISVIDAAVVLTFDGNVVSEARIALGSLAPTIVRARTAEDFLVGKRLTPEVCSEAAALACAAVSPIDDVRGTRGLPPANASQSSRPHAGGSRPGRSADRHPRQIPSFSTRIRRTPTGSHPAASRSRVPSRHASTGARWSCGHRPAAPSSTPCGKKPGSPAPRRAARKENAAPARSGSMARR